MTSAGEGSPSVWSWASTGDDMTAPRTGGTLEELRNDDLKKGRLSLYSHCLDGSKGGLHFSNDLEQIIRTDAAVVALQDPHWSGAALATTVSNLDKLWSKGELWYKYWQGCQPKKSQHGVFLAVRKPWSRRVLDSFGDARNWGRFGGVILQGASGEVAFISLYAPAFGKGKTDDKAGLSDVGWQEKQIEALKLGLNPWDLLRRDLKLKVLELQAAGITVIVAGDTNSSWDLRVRLHAPDKATRDHIEEWAKWATQLGLGNVWRLRDHDPQFTLRRSNTANDMDAVLMSETIAGACLVKAGVLSSTEENHRPPSDSEHWPVVVSFDFEAALGVDGEEIAGLRAAMGVQSSVSTPSGSTSAKIRASDTLTCEHFARDVERRFEAGDFVEAVQLLEKRDDAKSKEYYQEVDGLLEKMLGALRDASGVVTTQRQGVRRKFNDDGANSLRLELSTVKGIFACAHERAGRPRLEMRLRGTLEKNPQVAAKLGISEERLNNWTAQEASPETARADIAALRAEASLLITELKSEISKVSRAATRNDFARRANKKNGRGGRCLRTLTNVVLARANKGGLYASLVQEVSDLDAQSTGEAQGKPRKKRVTSNPEAVASGLVKQFCAWMGDGKTSWSTSTALDKDDDKGRAFRRAILDGTLDLEKEGVPPRFKPIIAALRRVDGADEEGAYKGLMDELSPEEWRRKIKSTKKGTTPGLSGESIDMLAALLVDSPDFLEEERNTSDLLRRCINLMLRSGQVFTQWRRRAICPIPKVQGNPDVALCRPLTLLSVSGKLFWSIMTDRVTAVWKKHQLLQKNQYGFRPGVSTDEPILIATLAAEQCYDLKQPLITISQDISKAFDSVSRGLKELAFGRLGLPEEFCELFASMDTNNKTVVLTAYGTSEQVLGQEKGVFECKRGYAQGCTSSASVGWVSFYDILLSLQNTIGVDGGTFRAMGDEEGECDRSSLAYADDAFYQAGGLCTSPPRRSAELKLAVASLFFDFTGVTFNASKTLCMAMEFPEDATAFTTAENDGWAPWTYDLDVIFKGGELTLLPETSPGGNDHIGAEEYRREAVKMVPVPDGMRYLGIWASPRLDAEVTKKWVEETADEIIDQVRLVPVDGVATRFLLEQVLWAKVGYRLRFERFAVAAFEDLERRVRELLLHRVRLGVRMSKDVAAVPAVIGGPDIPAWRDLVMADRLRVVQSHLDEGTTAAPLVRAAIARCQDRFGSMNPVFESPSASAAGWLESDSEEHGFIESLVVWCAEKDISLCGGRGLVGAAQGDAAVVDLLGPPPVSVSSPSAAVGALEEDVEEPDDVPDASALSKRQQLNKRGRVQRALFEMDQHFASDFLLLDGKTANLDAVHYTKYRGEMRTLLREQLKSWEKAPIPRFLGNDVKAGDVILARSDALMELAEVVAVSGADVRVVFLDRAAKKNLKSARVGDSVFAKRKDTSGAQYAWQPGTVLSLSKSRASVRRPSGVIDEQIPLADKCIRVLDHERRVWKEGDDWTSSDASATWMHSSRHSLLHIGRAVRLPTRRFDCSGYFSLSVDDADFKKLIVSLDELASSQPHFLESRLDAVAGERELTDPEEKGDLLGRDDYLDTVRQRCGEWSGGLDALSYDNTTGTTFVASDGSYSGVGRGAWGLVFCRDTGIELFSGRVDSGCGTNSPYRSEAYGLLAGLRHAYDARVAGPIVHILDNMAVVRVFQNCELRASSLVSSTDVWDEIIWYKKQLGPRYSVHWSRGHAELRGGFVTWADRANHLADGLASAGYDAATDIRRYFTHGRCWHVKMGGLRPFDDIRSSARLHIGTARFKKYRAAHSEDSRELDTDFLRAVCGGAPSRSVYDRAESTKFIHQQLATSVRLSQWDSVPTSAVVNCRACGLESESIQHLLISCTATKCRTARRTFLDALYEFAALTSSDIGDFLKRRLTLSRDGCLLFDGDEMHAFGFVTCHFPSAFRDLLSEIARQDDDAVRKFLFWFRRRVKSKLWRPTWEAAKANSPIIYAQVKAAASADTSNKDFCLKCSQPTVLLNGAVDGVVLLCDLCEGEVHLSCSGFVKVPSGTYHCGCLISDDESVDFDKDNDSDGVSSVSSLDESFGDDLSNADVSVSVFACDKTDYESDTSSHASTSLDDS
jgi:hypothetical protein